MNYLKKIALGWLAVVMVFAASDDEIDAEYLCDDDKTIDNGFRKPTLKRAFSKNDSYVSDVSDEDFQPNNIQQASNDLSAMMPYLSGVSKSNIEEIKLLLDSNLTEALVMLKASPISAGEIHGALSTSLYSQLSQILLQLEEVTSESKGNDSPNSSSEEY